MNTLEISLKQANALLVAPVMPDSENLSFPHDTPPVTDESVEKVKEIINGSRLSSSIPNVQSNYAFKGTYIAESVDVQYRKQFDTIKEYEHIPDDHSFKIEVAIIATLEINLEDQSYESTLVRMPTPEELEHEAPYPSHPVIKKVTINGMDINSATHPIDTSVLDKIVQNANDCLDNCEHGGGYVPYSTDSEYECFLYQ